MKRASHIMIKVGSIIGFVCMGILFACAIAFIVLGLPAVTEQIVTESKEISLEAARTAWSIAFISYGVVMAIIGVFCLLSSIFALKADKSHDKKAYIISIVFSALGNEINLAGSILGLIGHRHDNDKVVDVEAK